MTSKEARSHPEKIVFNKYKNGKEDGVIEYAILNDGIILKFLNNPHYYLYTFSTPGIKHVEQMIERAKKDSKLNTYITQYVKKNYEDKWIPDLNEAIKIAN